MKTSTPPGPRAAALDKVREKVGLKPKEAAKNEPARQAASLAGWRKKGGKNFRDFIRKTSPGVLICDYHTRPPTFKKPAPASK